MPVFPANFERVAGNLLSLDGSATQLPAILLAILLGVDAPLRSFNFQNKVLYLSFTTWGGRIKTLIALTVP